MSGHAGYPALFQSRANGITAIGGFGRPFGLARDRDGRIYIADMDLHAVCRIAPGLREAEWLDEAWSDPAPIRHGETQPAPPRSPGRFNGPHSVAIGGDGRIYIVTYYTPGLHILAGDGRSISGAQRSTIAFAGPATGHFDRKGRLLVAEYRLHGIFAMTAGGEFIGALGGGHDGFGAQTSFAAGSGPAAFDRPHMCRARPDGALVVADTWNHRLQLFTQEGRFVGTLGQGTAGWREDAGGKGEGSGPGAFSAPVAVSFAGDGRFVVTDWGNKRLQWFDHDGRLLKVDAQLGLDRPYDAQIFGNRLAIADSHHGRVLFQDL